MLNSSTNFVLRFCLSLLIVITVIDISLPWIYGKAKENAQLRESIGEPREWPISPLRQVAMTVEDSINFSLDTPAGEAQWAAIMPPNDGYVTVNSRRYRLAMFHQLDCLDTIRQSLLSRKANVTVPPSEDAMFCLNYIRQAILCRSDTQLEWVRSEYGGKSVQPFVTHSNCRDWTQVYDALGREIRAQSSS